MCSAETSKRITYKRTRPNPLFQEWLEELHEDAKIKKSKLKPMLEEALDSISKYPLPLQTGAECAVLKGFEKKLCIFLDKRLEIYKYNKSIMTEPDDNNETEQNQPDGNLNNEENGSSLGPIVNSEELVTLTEPTTSGTSKPRKKNMKTYKPSFRSGGYAILMGLFEQVRDNPNQPLSKEELIEKAQPHSEESFIRPKPDTFYTAWSNMTKLVTKGLVQKSRENKTIKYTLTDAGISLAMELIDETVSTPTINDIIFNDVNDVNIGTVSTVVPQERPVATNTNNVEEKVMYGINDLELKAGNFDIILIIDKNETSGVTNTDPTVAQFNKYPALKHEYRSLKIGDFTWIAQDRLNRNIELVLPYVIERKRMDDLGGSIKDGRFHEQKFRLRKCGLKNVIYLVENFGKNKHVGLPMQSLMQALANTRVQDGFKVHMTDSLANSVRFLAMMSKRLTMEYKDKNLKGRYQDPHSHSVAEPHSDLLMTFQYFNALSKKSKPLTVTETFIKLILQLKGVSVEKALAIVRTHSTPSVLIQQYIECDQDEGRLLLAGLKYGETSRKVGPVVSRALFQLFTNSV